MKLYFSFLTKHSIELTKCGFINFSPPGAANYTPAAQSGYVTPSYGATTQRATGYDQSQYASQTQAYASKFTNHTSTNWEVCS